MLRCCVYAKIITAFVVVVVVCAFRINPGAERNRNYQCLCVYVVVTCYIVIFAKHRIAFIALKINAFWRR